jgi:hypothetical protein
MSLVVLILLVVSIILLGAAAGKPLGWVAIGLGVLALLLALFNGWPGARSGSGSTDVAATRNT